MKYKYFVVYYMVSNTDTQYWCNNEFTLDHIIESIEDLNAIVAEIMASEENANILECVITFYKLF